MKAVSDNDGAYVLEQTIHQVLGSREWGDLSPEALSEGYHQPQRPPIGPHPVNQAFNE